MNNLKDYIPSSEDWVIQEGDLDAQWAKKKFLGRDVEQAALLFKGNVIETCSDLRHMPDNIFQYYIFSLVMVIEKEWYGRFDAADVADGFLSVIELRAKKNKDTVKSIYKNLLPVMKDVSEKQEYYGAPLDIYGSFREKFNGISKLIG